MKASWSWLRELVDVEASLEEVCRRLTLGGFEIEHVERQGGGFTGVVVAEVRKKVAHPTSKKLSLVDVWDGAAVATVVCGAPNVPEPGRKVLWARPGATLPGGITLGVKAVGGVPSPGMLCAEDELGIGEAGDGIHVLDAGNPTAPGATAQEALGLTDTILEVNVTPNRGDALSHWGLAREVAALCGGRLKLPDQGAAPLTRQSRASLPHDLGAALGDAGVELQIVDAAGCPRYSARLIDGVRVGPSPRWVAQRLEAVGVRPISNVVDVTNYVMFELGQPLHAFDADKVSGGVLGVRRASAGERLTTLDDVERILEPEDLVIIDGSGPVALAGVMGGASTQVTETTTRIYVESAVFDPRAVRRTSKRLGLGSESSYRFERGVDVDGVAIASARAARLYGELAGGRSIGVAEAHPTRPPKLVIDLAPARARAVLGMPLDDDEIAAHLGALGLGVAKAGAGLAVTIPPSRPDLEREIDLVEEVGRLAGYDRMPATLPAVPQLEASARAPELAGVDVERLADAARDALSAAGLCEAQTYAFTSVARLLALRFPAGHGAHPGRAISVRNPIRDDHTVLRTSLVPNLVAAAARARASFVPDVRLFEVGRVFLPSGRELPDEPLFAAGVLVGRRSGWLKDGGPLDFWDARAVIEELAARLGLTFGYAPARNEEGFLHPGVAAAVTLEGQHLGVVGELHPETRDRLGLEAQGFAFELNLSMLGPRAAHKLAPIPRFPAVARDVSFLVDDFVPAAQIREVIEGARPALLAAVQVLEDYREEGHVPAGKKGMLWSMTYRAADRTLTDAEVDTAHAALIQALLTSVGGVQR